VALHWDENRRKIQYVREEYVEYEVSLKKEGRTINRSFSSQVRVSGPQKRNIDNRVKGGIATSRLQIYSVTRLRSPWQNYQEKTVDVLGLSIQESLFAKRRQRRN
jgi:hypothetical protein